MPFTDTSKLVPFLVEETSSPVYSDYYVDESNQVDSSKRSYSVHLTGNGPVSVKLEVQSSNDNIIYFPSTYINLSGNNEVLHQAQDYSNFCRYTRVYVKSLTGTNVKVSLSMNVN